MNVAGKSLAAAVLVVATWTSLAGAQPNAAALAPETREVGAPPRILTKLNGLRAQITEKKLSFTVGYTAALDRTIAQLAGTRPPANLRTLMKEQNQRVRALRANVHAPAPCTAADASFDWRTSNKVTPVRDQGACGSCWAFGTVAAYEGSYARTQTHTDLSEQDVLSCSTKGSCNGGWWAFDYYVPAPGVAREADYPYTASDSACQSAPPRKFRAAEWGYVDDTVDIPSVTKLKTALCEHGPIAIAVNATDAFVAYTGGVFDEHDAGQVNHAITLVGWNEAKKAWLIKNSWGTVWGETGGVGAERGYMWIAYDSNKVGYGAAWVEPLTDGPVPPPITPPPGPTPLPGLSVWMVIALALALATVELVRRARGKGWSERA